MTTNLLFIATKQGRPPTGQQHYKGRNSHGQHNVLGAFAKLASPVGPKFDMKIVSLISKFQQKNRKPRQRTGNASPEHHCRQQENQKPNQYVESVHADARRMFEEQLELVPAEKCHWATGLRIVPAKAGSAFMGCFICGERAIGQRLLEARVYAVSGLLDGSIAAFYNARPSCGG